MDAAFLRAHSSAIRWSAPCLREVRSLSFSKHKGLPLEEPQPVLDAAEAGRGEAGAEEVPEIVAADLAAITRSVSRKKFPTADRHADGALPFVTPYEVPPRRTLVLMGVETECCVLQTLLAALDQGYHVVLVSDCVGSSTQALHDAVLAKGPGGLLTQFVADGGLKIVTSAELLADVAGKVRWSPSS